MNEKSFQVLELQKVKDQIAMLAITNEGKKRIQNIKPVSNSKQIESWLAEISEAKEILKISRSVPIHGLEGMENILVNLNKGRTIRPSQFNQIVSFLDHCNKIKRFMEDKRFVAPIVSSYVESIEALPHLLEEIQRCIRHGQVDDYSSKALLKVRKELKIEEERLKDKLQHIVGSKKYKSYLQDAVITLRNGRYTIPIKKEYHKKVAGTVVDQSASGSTLYIEPEEIQVIQGKIEGIKWTEELEEEQVLMYLTGLIENEQSTINISVETMLVYDCLFAKAKYSEQINGTRVRVNESHRINLIEAKHPLLTDPVPLNLTLGNGVHALVITGPNTGGKTVTIKTVGILTLMTQCGFHIPVQEGSEISIYQSIYVDIGDGQSIEENLSTFSSRLVNVIDILRKTNDRSLVLVDELGSGTDPSEGMGLAISILDELYEKGATILATTHFNEMKKFAINRKGFLNGSMEFDLDKLQPTYRLILGETGNSQAFEIALKLGLHQKLIEKAHLYTYGTDKSFKQTNAKEDTSQLALNRYVKRETKEMNIKENKVILRVGDSVRVKATDEIGIVYKAPNEKGEIIIQVKGEKRTIQEKRIELFIAKEELYPDDYDFDIIFKSVDYRKNSKLLNKRHTPGLEINSED